MPPITQANAKKNVAQLGAKIFDSDAIMEHPKQAQILSCFKRMKDAADAKQFNAIRYLAAESNLSTFLK
jgi:ABC-type enterochelin transport system substrate-binding protein